LDDTSKFVLAVSVLGLFGLLGFLAYLTSKREYEPQSLEIVETPEGWIIQEKPPKRKVKL